MRIYLDTAPVIYSVEHIAPYHITVDSRLQAAGAQLFASELTRLECRVKPVKDANVELLAEYDAFLREAVDEIVGLSTAVMERATHIRASYGFRTPDSIHLAAALEAACEVFFTNDHHLNRFTEVVVETV